MKVRDICLDIVAYFLISILLIFGGISEWKAGNKILSVLSFIVAAFMGWEGFENLIHHNSCKSNTSTDIKIDPNQVK